MKRIFFLALLLPNILFSQDFFANIMALKSELNYIDSIGQTIKSISISKNAEWIVLYGDFGYTFSFLPPKAKDYVIKVNQQKSKINDFDFINGDTSWVCLSKNNAFAFEKVPKQLGEGLKKLNKNQFPIYQLSFINNRWSIIYAKGKVLYNGFSNSAKQKVENLQENGRLIKHIALKEPDGYVFLYGRNEYWAENIQQECLNELENLKNNNNEINLVYFFNNAWIIIYDKHKFFCNF